MIRHCVLFRFKAGTPDDVAAGLLNEFAALKDVIPGIVEAKAGRNVSPEGLHRGYLHGFVMDLADAAARDAYLSHPAHVALSERLLPHLEGGIDGVAVADFEI